MTLHENTAVPAGTQRDEGRMPGGGDASRAGLRGSRGNGDSTSTQDTSSSRLVTIFPWDPSHLCSFPSLSTLSFALGSPCQLASSRAGPGPDSAPLSVKSRAWQVPLGLQAGALGGRTKWHAGLDWTDTCCEPGYPAGLRGEG